MLNVIFDYKQRQFSETDRENSYLSNKSAEFLFLLLLFSALDAGGKTLWERILGRRCIGLIGMYRPN